MAESKKSYEYPYVYELVISDEEHKGVSVATKVYIYAAKSWEASTKLNIVLDQLGDWGLYPWVRRIGQAKEHTPEVKDLIEVINTKGFSIDEIIDAEIRLKELGVIEKEHRKGDAE